MTWNQSLKPLAAAAFLCGAIDTPMLAAPADQAPIATEQVGGTILSVIPQISWEAATLRVSGPDDYALTKRFPPGTPISTDLLTEAELAEGESVPDGRGLPPHGRYRYEVVLTTSAGESQRHTGMFFVEDGIALARDTKQAALGAIREDLAAGARPEGTPAQGEIGSEGEIVSDYLLIFDSENDGDTRLLLGSDNPTNASSWYFYNYQGDVDIVEVLSVGGSSSRMFIEQGGQVGIGTTAPLQELHIDSGDGGDIRLSGAGADWVLGTIGGSGDFVLQDRTNLAASVLRLKQGAPAGSLVVDADGRVGIGTVSPAAQFDVQGHVRGATFQSASSRTLKTGFEAVDPAEVLAKLSELPVTSWRYKADDGTAIHIGPVAEDFQRLFGLGDGETIANVDAIGVLMAAVQGLQQQMEHRDRQIAQLRHSLSTP